eukprot:scpid55311/ scgid0961/ 
MKMSTLPWALVVLHFCLHFATASDHVADEQDASGASQPVSTVERTSATSAMTTTISIPTKSPLTTTAVATFPTLGVQRSSANSRTSAARTTTEHGIAKQTTFPTDHPSTVVTTSTPTSRSKSPADVSNGTSPVHTTPVHTTPVHTTPVHTTPVHTTPVHTAPVHTAPVHTTPVHTAPGRTAPVHTAPGHTAASQNSTTPNLSTHPTHTRFNSPSSHTDFHSDGSKEPTTTTPSTTSMPRDFSIAGFTFEQINVATPLACIVERKDGNETMCTIAMSICQSPAVSAWNPACGIEALLNDCLHRSMAWRGTILFEAPANERSKSRRVPVNLERSAQNISGTDPVVFVFSQCTNTVTLSDGKDNFEQCVDQLHHSKPVNMLQLSEDPVWEDCSSPQGQARSRCFVDDFKFMERGGEGIVLEVKKGEERYLGFLNLTHVNTSISNGTEQDAVEVVMEGTPCTESAMTMASSNAALIAASCVGAVALVLIAVGLTCRFRKRCRRRHLLRRYMMHTTSPGDFAEAGTEQYLDLDPVTGDTDTTDVLDMLSSGDKYQRLL